MGGLSLRGCVEKCTRNEILGIVLCGAFGVHLVEKSVMISITIARCCIHADSLFPI